MVRNRYETWDRKWDIDIEIYTMSRPLEEDVLWFTFLFFLQPVKNQFWSTCPVQQTLAEGRIKT